MIIERKHPGHLQFFAILVILLLLGFRAGEAAGQEPQIQFADVYAEAGGAFSHSSPLTEERHIHLTMGSGVGCIDFDHDGWSDLCFGQGCSWDGKFFSPSKPYETMLRNVRGSLKDVSVLVGLRVPYYTMGIASGDSNNDGFDDLYMTSVGQNQLFINNGDGTFSSGVSLTTQPDGYSASCTWTDANMDGTLDLFISRYVSISEADYPLCVDEATKLGVLCPPWKFKALSDVMLIGHGDGTFNDNSLLAGMQSVDPQPGLAVATVDIDDDGDLDIYVANDSVPNHLWINDGSGRFTEDGFLAGVALNGNGEREAGMGIAVGDATADGRPDLLVTNYFEETNTFYRNEGSGFFQDVTDEIGIGAPSRSRLGFGVNFLDADGDSDLDVFVANGHVHDRLKELGRNIPYEQTAQLLTMTSGRFKDFSADAGTIFSKPLVGRSSATLDFNRDFRTDVVMTTLGGSPLLLENQTTAHGNVLKLRLIGRDCVRNATGARMTFNDGKGNGLVRFVDGSTSYLSTSEPVVTLGAGQIASIANIEVRWPNGKKQEWANLKTNEEWILVEGISIPFRIP